MTFDLEAALRDPRELRAVQVEAVAGGGANGQDGAALTVWDAYRARWAHHVTNSAPPSAPAQLVHAGATGLDARRLVTVDRQLHFAITTREAWGTGVDAPELTLDYLEVTLRGRRGAAEEVAPPVPASDAGVDAGAPDGGQPFNPDAGFVDAGFGGSDGGICGTGQLRAVQPLPQTNTLTDVWGTARDDVWAVGEGGAIVHWNGTQWGTLSTDPAISLGGVWGSGRDDVWVVGYRPSTGAVTLHWDGRSMTEVPNRSSGGLGRVFGFAANDVWAVGGGIALHWDGNDWREHPLPGSVWLSGIWGSRPNDLWVAGATNGAGRVWDSVIYHWDGNAWSLVSHGLVFRLDRLWGSAPNQVWAVGSWPDSHAYWDGTAWRPLGSPWPALRGIWGPAGEGPWLVGLDRAQNGILTRLGSSSPPAAVVPGTYFNAIWGTAHDDFWVVGQGGAIFHYSP